MTLRLFFLSFVTMFSLFSEDAAAPTSKKEVMPELTHVWFSEGLVCLKAKETGFAFANKSQSATPTKNFTTPSTEDPDFKWNCGLRIDAGFQPTDWFFFATWTYIQNTADGKKYTDATTGFFPALSLDKTLDSSNYVTSATFTQKINTQLVDLGTLISWRPAEPFILKSHFGLRIASINQKFVVNYGGGVFNEGIDTLNGKNNFLGAGPRIGLTPNIILPWGFSLVSNFSASALLGRFYIKQKEKYLTNTSYDNTHVMTRLRCSLDALAALSWQTDLFYKSLVFCTQIGWEWHKFYNQNEITHNSFDFSSSSNDLFLRGGFISVCLGF